jgi:phosphoglycolate phosphatase
MTPFIPKAILFDLDGTILDTARDLGNALNHVLTTKNLPLVSYEDYRNYASHGAMGLLKLGFQSHIDQYDVQHLRSEFLDFYNKNICVDTCVFEEVKRFLAILDEKSIPWGIVTNKPEKLTQVLLPHFEIFASCKVMVGGDTLSVAKPHPEPLLYAANTLAVAPQDIWYLGDALRDIQAANNANMLSIIANYGYIDDDENTDLWQSDFTVNHLDQLVPFLSADVE